MMFLISLLAFCVLIGVLVTVHEGGHFLMAKYFGVRVLSFSVGMGPAIIKHQVGETSYELRALPLGGYVQPLSLDMEIAKTMSEAERARALDAQARWKRILVYLAGPATNFLLAWICWSIVGMVGLSDISLELSKPPATSPVASMGIVEGDRLVAINGRPVQGFSETNMLLMGKLGEEVTLRFDRHQGIFEREVSLKSITLDQVVKTPVMIRLGLMPTLYDPSILHVLPDSPAMAAGLKAGDRIWAVNGTPMLTVGNVMMSIDAAGPHPVTLTVSPEGKPNEKTDITITPRPNGNRWQIGVNLIGMPHGLQVRYDPIDTLAYSYQRIVLFVGLNIDAIESTLTGKTDARETIQGPVGMASLAGKAAMAGWTIFLDTLGMFSLALGFMNLLPIPVLDGGEIMVLVVESVLRRDLPPRWRNGLKMAGLWLLLSLMVLTFLNDVVKLL